MLNLRCRCRFLRLCTLWPQAGALARGMGACVSRSDRPPPSPLPHGLRYYIDYQAMARDAELNGDLFTISTARDVVHVFAGCRAWKSPRKRIASHGRISR